MQTAISRDAQDSINNLKVTGIRFDFVQRVDYSYELFQIVDRKTQTVRFVCEVNAYGQITEWGDHLALSPRELSLGLNNKVFLADDEELN